MDRLKIKKHFKIYFLIAFCILAAGIGLYPSFAQDSEALKEQEEARLTLREYYLKAAFLQYVSRSVEWPEDALDENINVCVLGDIPSKKGIDSVDGRPAQSKTIKVLYIDDYQKAVEPKACQILYVTNSEKNSMKKIIQSTQGKPILTFGDMEGFAEEGGTMNFYVLNNRMAIMINLEATADSELVLNEKMLQLFTIIPHMKDFS